MRSEGDCLDFWRQQPTDQLREAWVRAYDSMCVMSRQMVNYACEHECPEIPPPVLPGLGFRGLEF